MQEVPPLDDVVIQSNSGFVRPPGDYGAHCEAIRLALRGRDYQQTNYPPNGYAREMKERWEDRYMGFAASHSKK